MKCENCGNIHDGSYGSGRFCCCRCARGFSTKVQREIINKIVSGKMKGRKCDLGRYKNRLGGYALLSVEEIFKIDTPAKNNSALISYIIRYNLPIDKCDHDNWNDEKLNKELHHKNMNKRDARLENLALLCPNCHSLADRISRRLKTLYKPG